MESSLLCMAAGGDSNFCHTQALLEWDLPFSTAEKQPGCHSSQSATVTGAGQYYHHTMQNLVMPTAVHVMLYFNTSSVDNTDLISESGLRKKIMINFTIPVFVFVKFNLLPC